MTTWLLIIGTSLVLVATGARRGARRLLALPTGMLVGAWSVRWLGPALKDLVAGVTGFDVWAGDLLCWMSAYCAVTALVASAILRIFPSLNGADRSRRFHLSGAVVGGLVGGVMAWGAFGNLPDLALEHLPQETADATFDLRRPFEIMRACRTLSSLSPAEAEQIATRPEVLAVLDNDSMEKLLRTPGMLRKFSRAADGDWKALGSLANDESVKAAMREPEFLERVRAVDILRLAEDLEQRRSAGLTDDRVALAEVRLPSFVTEADFQAHLADELDLGSSRPTDVEKSPLANLPTGPDGKIEAAAYWRGVGSALEWYDRPSTAASLLPNLIKPPTPSATSKSVDGAADSGN